MTPCHRLSDLLRDVEGVRFDAPPPADLMITGVAYRASQVSPGQLFVGLGTAFVPELKGLDIGADAAQHAISAGAAAILLPLDAPAPPRGGVPVLRARDPARATAVIAARFHGRPTDRLRLLGITGTNGKTTVAAMLRQIHEAAGATPATLGTLGIESRVLARGPGPFTTPPSPEFFAAAAELLSRGVDTLIMETTSHGLALAREWGAEYDAAVFTNLTPDHLDLHRTLDVYRDVKLSLFRRLGAQANKREPLAVLNADDPACPRFAEAASGARIVRYGVHAPADYQASEIQQDLDGLRFALRLPGGHAEVRSPLSGLFNVHNALAAFACAHASGIPTEAILRGLAGMRPVPGRFQVVPGAPCTAIVDFAHTPDGLEKTLTAARALCRGRLWVVFGCGGDRDRSKRPKMGRIAAELADVVVVTSDNPRDEEPRRILAEIAAGVPAQHSDRLFVMADRREAIEHALAGARASDVVVVAGKGHEKVQIVGGVHHPFDDVQVVGACRRGH